MTTKQIVKLINEKFIAALQSKTGWGRNELTLLHSNIMVEVLAQAIDNIATEHPSEKKDDTPQDKYDSIIFEHTQITESDDQFIDEEEMMSFWNVKSIEAHDFNEACGDK